MEQLNFNFGLGGALPKGYTLSSYTFGQAINTIDIESVNIPENVKVILNTFISNDKIMNVPLSNNKALLSYFKIIKKFNVKPKADFLDFLVTREYISEFPDNNPTKESEVAVGILDSYIENTSGQVMANGGGVENTFVKILLDYGFVEKRSSYGVRHFYNKFKNSYASLDDKQRMLNVYIDDDMIVQGRDYDGYSIRELINYLKTNEYESGFTVNDFDNGGGVGNGGGSLIINKESDGKYRWKFTFKNGKIEKSFDGFNTSADAQKDFQYRSKYFKMSKGGGVGNTEVGEWRKGSSINYKTKKEASDRLKFLKNYPNEYKNLRIIKTDSYNPYSVKFEFFKKDDNYSNGGEVKNKKLENIKNRLFAKHKK